MDIPKTTLVFRAMRLGFKIRDRKEAQKYSRPKRNRSYRKNLMASERMKGWWKEKSKYVELGKKYEKEMMRKNNTKLPPT